MPHRPAPPPRGRNGVELRTRVSSKRRCIRLALQLARLCALALAFCLLTPPSVGAQPGIRLSGRVTGPEGAAAAGARVQVTAPGGGRFEARTDSAGRYHLVLPARGDAFLVSVEAPGLSPATRLVDGQPGAPTPLVADFELPLKVVPLVPVRVAVERLSVASVTRWTPGSEQQSRSGMQFRTDPVGADLLSDLAAQQAGVAATPDGLGLSLGGQAPDQTRLTMDGGGMGSAAIPREAIGAVNLLTNTYDVARGGFTGGQVDVRTLGAGNEWGGTFRLEGRDPRLQYGDAPNASRQRASYLGVDAGGGGGLVRDRLFAYGALTVRRTEFSPRSLNDLTAADLQRLGVDADSLRRFQELTAPVWPAPDPPGSSTSGLASGLVRLDAILSPRHSLTLRLNRQVSEAGDAGSMFAVAGTGSGMRATDRGIFAQLSSGGPSVANDLKVWLGTATRDRWVSDAAPEGVVTVASASAAGGLLTRLRFAGSPVSAQDSREREMGLLDEFVMTTTDGRHRLRVGTEVSSQRQTGLAMGASARFEYATLADFEAGRPALFTRLPARDGRETEVRRAAFFIDDHWRPGALQLSYGLRAERAWYAGDQAPNPAVEDRFGRSPGSVSSRWRLSPRVGFGLETRMPWDRGKDGRTYLQGGFGEFVGLLPLPAFGFALNETGLADEAMLVCAGPAAPRPDWVGYRRDPRLVPSTCADGSPAFASEAPDATLFAPDFLPRAWRASFGGQGVLPNGVLWNVHASFARGVNQPVAYDRNLREPAFLITEEAGRPVYVEPGRIVPETGVASFSGSRRFPELGTVREITGDGRSRALQVTATASQVFNPTPRLRLLGFMSGRIGYTWTDARETAGGLSAPGRAFSSTGGDPSRLEWAATGYTPRHMVHIYADSRPSKWLTVGLIGRAASGTPYTPMVSGDVNGDGVQADRAFVFDPEAPAVQVSIGRGMERLLDQAPAGARECLRTQLGRIAGHNSCRTGWTWAVDLTARANLGPRLPKSVAHRRVSLWLYARNVPAGLDYLLHGADGLRGWGQSPSVDQTLLSVRGFDPVANRFQYEVNPRFGSRSAYTVLRRSPFILSIQVRVVVGTDRSLAVFNRERDAGSNQQEAFSPANVALHLGQQLPNVPAEVLALNGPQRLYLTPEQAVRLQQAADSLAPRIESIVRELTGLIATPGGAAPLSDPVRIRDLGRQAIALRTGMVAAARSILNDEQWSRLPERLRNPAARFEAYPTVHVTSGPGF